MTSRNKKGEAVTLAVMGIMMVGGLLLWMFSGHSHMFGMHGGRHPASEVRSGERHEGVHDAQEGHPGEEGDDVPERDGLRTPGGDERNP
ncbi:MAG: hypothetical protein ACYC37_11770 [Desulfobacteria bacterium]